MTAEELSTFSVGDTIKVRGGDYMCIGTIAGTPFNECPIIRPIRFLMKEESKERQYLINFFHSDYPESYSHCSALLIERVIKVKRINLERVERGNL